MREASGGTRATTASEITFAPPSASEVRARARERATSRRVRQAGYRVVVANQVTVTHVRGVSSRSRPYWVEVQKHRGLWRYFNKHERRLRTPWQRRWVATGLFANLLWVCARRLWVSLRR